MRIQWTPWIGLLLLPVTVVSQSSPIHYSDFAVPATSQHLDRDAKGLEMPGESFDKNVPTLNRMGSMLLARDKVSEEFIKVAAGWGRQNVASLDVGAAYGVATVPALECGAMVIANDLDKKQLLILRSKTPDNLRHRLFLSPGSFPGQMNFPHNSLGAILLRRVVHFLTPAEMDLALDKLYDWLVPGGSVFIVTMSPYHPMMGDFKKTYEAQWRQGNPWPGEIFNAHKLVPYGAVEIPKYLHVMDARPLVKALEKRGFIIKKAFLYGYNFPDSKGIEINSHCGIIAQKPK